MKTHKCVFTYWECKPAQTLWDFSSNLGVICIVCFIQIDTYNVMVTYPEFQMYWCLRIDSILTDSMSEEQADATLLLGVKPVHPYSW